MSYYVKMCDKCKTANHPSMTYCAKCGADLPTTKYETDTKPMTPPAYAVTEPAPELASQSSHSSKPRETQPSAQVQCRITDIDMPFWSLVSFMAKCAIAAIPALIIATIIIVFSAAILAAIFGGIGSR